MLIFSFKERVFRVVKKIKGGNFLTYKEVAKRAGNERAFRAVGNILKNSPLGIPCHRVIRGDNLVGGYMGRKDWDWMKAGMLLGEGAIGVIPTDTLYGICTSAFNKKSVEKIYKLRKRNPEKPFIILISGLDELKKFGVKLNSRQREILEKIWPGKISVILSPQINAKTSRFALEYLHRGTGSLAFRLPKQKLILDILKISGPLVAPSANWEGYNPAKNIGEAKKYFGKKVFYLDRGELVSKPSTLIELREKIKILREGEDLQKIKMIRKRYFSF
jgi:L-threonylcarbamoyladenylate synthase